MTLWLRRILIPALAVVTLHAAPELEGIPTYQLGLDALNGRLWEVAASRFESALETEELPAELRPAILLRLAEARIRGSQPEQALKTLADPALAEHPEQAFWYAQALAAAGRFSEAIEAISALDPKSPHQSEAALTKALLQRAIGDSRASLETIDALLSKPKPPTAAKLLKAEILLANDQPAEAAKALPDAKGISVADAKVALLLRARCQLALGEPGKAETGFADLIGTPEQQTLINHHTAHVGLARAKLQQGNREKAADGLLAFIQKSPQSPLLDDAFSVLLECLPDEPAPNDPILTRVREWVPPARVEAPLITGTSDLSQGACPLLPPTSSALAPEALFHLAVGTRKESTPSSQESARRLLTRLRLEFPSHPLVPHALLEAGRWNLEDGRREQARSNFESLERLGSASPPELRAQALTLEAGTLFDEKDFEAAGLLFDQAADLLEDERRRSARLNAATSLLSAGNVAAFDKLEGETTDPRLQTQLALERSLHLSSTRSPDALPALLAFIQQHPDHPRLAEARLNAALSALDATKSNPDQAEKQLAALNDEQTAGLPPGLLALARIRLYERRGQWAEAAEFARKFMVKHGDSPLRDLILYEQGKALFQNKDYNDARIVLQTLAQESPDCPQAPAALLLSARAAAEGGTPQSQKESLQLFDQLIDSDSAFHEVARLEKADLLIRLSLLKEAVETLDPWFDEMADDSPLLLSTGQLLGDALFAQAQGDPKILERALEVYERLLKILIKDSPARSRIIYQKGLALEQFEGRVEEALKAYMDVVQAATGSTRGDWKSIELCGFSALRILEKQEKWRAAKSLARRIADLKGPRFEEAAERAKTLGLKHFIWDE